MGSLRGQQGHRCRRWKACVSCVCRALTAARTSRRHPWLLQPPSHGLPNSAVAARPSLFVVGLYLTKVKGVELFHSLSILQASGKMTQTFQR